MYCYIYLTPSSYNLENPDIELQVFSVKKEGNYLMLEEIDGYSHIINLMEIFAVTYKS